MVLEEEIHFSAHETAQAFSKVLKGLGISAQIRQKATIDLRLMFSGTYLNLAQLLGEITTDEAYDEEESESFSMALEHLTSQRDMIADSFEKYQPGDQIGKGIMDMVSGDQIPEGDIDDAELEQIIEDIYLTRLLHVNDLLEIRGGGLFLIQTINPDEAILTIFAEDIPMIPEEILKEHSISSTMTAVDEFEYIVTAGSEIVFLEDLSPISDFFEEHDIDDDETGFVARLQVKQILIAEILGMIKEGGKASREDIGEEFSERDIETGEEDSRISLNMSRAYIDAVLDDLKKSGIIKGKDQKLRMAM
ncbi:MAG TPA: hypothetical protein VN372_12590 [Methanospirillum sp.]|nr:hypothetical protein [Methanospirillum sp.]